MNAKYGNQDCKGYKDFREFIDSIKSRKRTLTPVEIAHRSQTPGHLGYIAAVTGRKLKWEAVKQEIIGDDTANSMLSSPQRAPYGIDSMKKS